MLVVSREENETRERGLIQRAGTAMHHPMLSSPLISECETSWEGSRSLGSGVAAALVRVRDELDVHLIRGMSC